MDVLLLLWTTERTENRCCVQSTPMHVFLVGGEELHTRASYSDSELGGTETLAPPRSVLPRLVPDVLG